MLIGGLAMEWIASTAFGLEGQTAKDLRRLGISGVCPQPSGGVLFTASPLEAFAANLWIRCADRIMLVVGRFDAQTFESLFEQTRNLPWENYIPRDGAFPVRAHCARSKLMSPRDCQSIVKKAIVERMKSVYHIEWCEETSSRYQVDIAIHENTAMICLDSSGIALNRRGYRTWNGEAPIRETLAAGLVFASPWHPNMPLWDPCCGTGTLLIEAAFIALNRAPGLRRAFDCEQWDFMPKEEIRHLRQEAEEAYLNASNRPLRLVGSDISESALTLARRHIAQAGLDGKIELLRMDLKDIPSQSDRGAFLCNPPYGDRLGDKKSAAAVEKQLIMLKQRCEGWSLSAISADMSFERNAASHANKKRRFYNGRLECEFLTWL